MSGTTTAASVNGTASFPGLSVQLVGTYRLGASSPLLSPAVSGDFQAVASGLHYVEPPPGGKVRLVRNSAESSPSVVVLELRTEVAMTGYSAAMNLPLDTSRAQASTPLMTPGTALPAGSSPAAAMAVIPSSGPLASVLVTGQSQKAAGTGAVPTDTALSAGAVLYTLRLEAVSGAPAGVVFDGEALDARFKGLLRNKLGEDQATSADFRIGRLELH